jgi:hypothetical protein
MQVRNVNRAPQTPAVEPRGQRQAKGTGEASADRVEISEAGRQAILVEQLARRVLEFPEVRPAVVEAARRSLDSGELDSPAAFRATATALRQAV